MAPANVLLDFDRDFPVGEAANGGCAQVDAEVAGDFLRQRGVCVSGENQKFVGCGRLHKLAQDQWDLYGAPRSMALTQNVWQGRKDSNPRMSESKSDALTNLATPLRGMIRNESP